MKKVVSVTCDLDCAYVAQLYRLPGKLARDAQGHARSAAARTRLSFTIPKTKGTYRVRLTRDCAGQPGAGDARPQKRAAR